MKIILEIYGNIYTVESSLEEYDSDELIEMFARMLVQASFNPSVIRTTDGGRFECKYKEVDETTK